MPKSGITGSNGSSIFSFLRNLHTVSLVVVPIYIPTNNVVGFPFFHTSPAFAICRLINEGHFDGCEMVVLICISLIVSDAEHFFHVPIGHPPLLWSNVYLGLLPIFRLGSFLWLSCMSCLYVLEINPLLVHYLQIFSSML